MKKLYMLSTLMLTALCFSLSVRAADVLWQSDFSTEEGFLQWTVVDANQDGVTWEYTTEQAPAPVIYRYHYSNPGDDWLVSPGITPTEDGVQMVNGVMIHKLP